jgi:hypothetical protein
VSVIGDVRKPPETARERGGQCAVALAWEGSAGTDTLVEAALILIFAGSGRQ